MRAGRSSRRGVPGLPAPEPGPARAPPTRRVALAPLLEELRPDAVVSDILTLAPALAAEVAGVPRATLIPHIYPVHEPGLPFFAVGVQPPRTPVGRAMWRAGLPMLETGLRRGREELNAQRARLGLPPHERFHGGISRELALVATFPQLEYPRPWPAGGEGDRADGLRAALRRHRAARGEEPLVLVAPSTSQDPRQPAGADGAGGAGGEPVRVVATTNRAVPRSRSRSRPNAVLVDWLQLQPGDAARHRWSSATAATGRWRGRWRSACRCWPCPPSATWRRPRRGSAGPASGARSPGGLPRPGRCAGWCGSCSVSRHSRRGPAARELVAGTTGAARARSWSRLVEAADRAEAEGSSRGWDSNPQPLG